MTRFTRANLHHEFENAGYKLHRATDNDKKMKGDWYVALYQKRVGGAGYISYFINISQYDYEFYNLRGEKGFLYEVDVQVESLHYADTHLNLKFNPHERTLEEVEELVRMFFENFGRDYE